MINPIRFTSAADYAKQLDAAFDASLDVQTKDLIKGKWIDDSLQVIDKPEGFWRKLKISILCFLTLGLYDQFAHVRAYKVAITIFDSTTTYRKNLSNETLKKSIQLLEALNKKTKQKYKNDMGAVIEKIQAILRYRQQAEQSRQKTFQDRMNERTDDRGIQVMIETLDESELENKIKQAEQELKNKKGDEDFITGTINYIKSWQPW